MKRIRFELCILALLAATALSRSVAGAEDKVKILGVTAITDSHSEGEKWVGLAIEYDDEFRAGTAERASFFVRDREISRVYVNNSGKIGDAKYTGRIIMVELAISNVPGSIVGNTIIHGKFDYPNNVYERLPVAWTNSLAPSAPFMFQSGDLKAISGKVAPGGILRISKETNPLVETFKTLVFDDPNSDVNLPYRLYVPEGYESKSQSLANLPLVIFLHGSGSRGDNNITQLISNPSALEFARPEAQAKHPCFILAPQNPITTDGWATNIGTAQDQKWVTTPQLTAVKTLADELIGKYNIDTARIYGTGLSQGSKGTMRLFIDHPTFLAAQMNSSGYDRYTDEEIASIGKRPTWQLIAVDDNVNPSANTRKVMEQFEKAGFKVVKRMQETGWNGFLRGPAAWALAQEQWDAAKKEGANILYTEYLPATIEPSRHWSWQANYANDVVRDWLFSHVNPAPYAPGK